MLGRPPTDSGRRLPQHPHALKVVTHEKAHGAKATTFTLHRDTTPLPAAISHPSSVGAKHVASSGGTLMRTGLGLVVVIALIYGVYWLLKRHNGSKTGRSDGRMIVIATTALAPNRALHLVTVGDELVLVGSAEQGVTPIRVYSEDEAAELRARLDGDPPPLRPASGFGGGFGGFVTEMRAKTVRK
jgi:flagellar biosynthetic protein FliO